MTTFQFALVDALQKVLPTLSPSFAPPQNTLAFAGSQLLVQLAYSCENDDLGCGSRTFTVTAQTDLPGAAVTAEQVCLVPCAYPCHGTVDSGYLDTRPGLYPDLLLPLPEKASLKAVPLQWRTVLFRVRIPDTTPGGRYALCLQMYDGEKNTLLQTLRCSYTVCAHRLPPSRLLHTEWLYADCLADYYQVPAFSEEHWRILDRFMQAAHQHGINMLLTPLFTPPLDTAPGTERTTVQLVGVEKCGEQWHFDFSRLERWMELCQKNGIKYLEMSHLFTQWGARFAPKVVGTVEGRPGQHLFGWETQATDPAYMGFLHQLFPPLKGLLADKWGMDAVWFHLSDEPGEGQEENLLKARAAVQDLLEGCRVMDALSSYEFYRRGIVSSPVVSADAIHTFLEAEVPHLWVYYCTCQAIQVPNRFIAMPNGRNRILGTLLYYFNLEGFLHWGFNFYNSQLSLEHIDPYRVNDAGEAFPSGDPFLVYPAPDGSAYDSLRGATLIEAMEDYRSLQLLEEQKGRPFVLELIDSLAGYPIGFQRYPTDIGFFATLREKVVGALSE